jgi:AAA+ superfamily predicted ATPase
MPSDKLFEEDRELPDAYLDELGRRLIGFEERYARIVRDVKLFLDTDGLKTWSKKHYGKDVPLLTALGDRYPLIAFIGDVGTGKSVTATALASRLTRDLGKEGWLFMLSTRVRGAGKVGEMSDLIAQAFTVVHQQAGKKRLAILIIDEADSIATERALAQSHHEDKVAVNTLIQRIDELRRVGGRVLVILCTNRFEVLDPAIVRRIAWIERFERPEDDDRRALLRMDLSGMDIDERTIAELVSMTGPREGKPGFTYSDLRTRLLPSALARAYPERRLEAADLLATARELRASPALDHGG